MGDGGDRGEDYRLESMRLSSGELLHRAQRLNRGVRVGVRLFIQSQESQMQRSNE